jgi:general secretion pathway protein D
VDLDQLLTRVSEATGKKFLVDPRVRVRVYGVPKIENVTYAELLTILRIHGFAAVEIGGRVNILPDANVPFLPVRVLNRDDDSASGPGDKLILMDTYANIRRMTEVINALSR